MPEISRRSFGGLVGGGAVTAVAGTTATAAAATPAATVPAERPFKARTAAGSGRRPNFLVVLGDDLGWADLSSYGAPHIRTPNLDRPARQGVRFTDAYSGSATCSPTSHEPLFSPDWTATLLELGGARPDPAYPLDGQSLACYLLRGEQAPERDLFWRVRANRALRRGDWKYYRDAAGADHLYNLAADQREKADRAPDEPELPAELKGAWEKIAAGPLPYPAA